MFVRDRRGPHKGGPFFTRDYLYLINNHRTRLQTVSSLRCCYILKRLASSSMHGRGATRIYTKLSPKHSVERYCHDARCLRDRSNICQIHVDRYKQAIYSHLAHEPFLASIITRNERSRRFHACERFNRCSEVEVNGRASHTCSGAHVVYVNPVNMTRAAWASYLTETKQKLANGEEVNNLVSVMTIQIIKASK